MQNLKLQKMKGNYQINFDNIHEWKSHLEILSLPQGIENSRQFLFLLTDILQKTAFECPRLVWTRLARYTCLSFVRASLSTTFWVGTSCTGTLNINRRTFFFPYTKQYPASLSSLRVLDFRSTTPKPNSQGKRSFSVHDVYNLERLK